LEMPSFPAVNDNLVHGFFVYFILYAVNDI